MGNNLLKLSILLFFTMSCADEKTSFSNIANESDFGDFPTLIDKSSPIDVSSLMINQSVSAFILSSAISILSNKFLNELNSLDKKNKENHLKAIFVAINYLEVGEYSFWNNDGKTINGKIKIIRRFSIKNQTCVTYSETIKTKSKIKTDFTTACRNKDKWIIKNV